MFDELKLLRATPMLVRLLNHYAQLATADRSVWQDRLMELEETGAQELVRLHGDLIAHDWLEVNIGFTTGKKSGAMAGCYRVTPAGVRALKRAQVETDEEGTEASQAREASKVNNNGKPVWQQRRGRRVEPVILAMESNNPFDQLPAAGNG